MQDLVSQDVSQLEVDYHVIDRLLAAPRVDTPEAALRERFTTAARITEDLPVALSRAVCGAGVTQFVRARPLAPPVLL